MLPASQLETECTESWRYSWDHKNRNDYDIVVKQKKNGIWIETEIDILLGIYAVVRIMWRYVR